MTLPILYSFRRCPYAMRARLALASSATRVELREVVLRDKPDVFLDTSPKATVPVLDLQGEVLEESLDIMLWALSQADPEDWLSVKTDALELISTIDGPFKTHLDRCKYATRYADADPEAERAAAYALIASLEATQPDRSLLGKSFGMADAAVLPFLRQFARIDFDRFSTDFPNLAQRVLDFEASPRFAAIMRKYPQWRPGDAATYFPEVS